MEYRKLGGSGCSVSALALGTMTFGRETDEEGSHAQLDAFAAAGGTLIDTADVYSGGVSETIVGKWLASRPGEVTDKIVIATKGRFPTDTTDPNAVGLSRRHLDQALTASLRRLGIETIDLYQVHAWDPITPLAETLEFLDGAVRTGKIRYYGLSNFLGWQVQKAVDLAEARGLVKPVTLQPQYNLLSREIEWEIVPACESTGLGLLPWSPLAGGMLTGKYQRDAEAPADTRLSNAGTSSFFVQRSAAQRTWDVIETVRTIATEREISAAQVALAWVKGRTQVTSVIIGARTQEQFADNMAAADLVLTEKEMERLNTASEVPVDYPYGGMALLQRSRQIEGGWGPGWGR
ncbi:aldo/keto reductase [Kutzneria buriramensis]|uniref:aldo/keto reductase n=1 Tax=Kutzneria buriramensis TaxID=1045776 RepID=UPI000E23A5A4|nr:aldo/keto reductase [Kutzneria buriramensis]